MIRAWTDTPLCYVLCLVMRALDRTPESMARVLPFARLFFTALHALPDWYVFTGAQGLHLLILRPDVFFSGPICFEADQRRIKMENVSNQFCIRLDPQ